MSIVNVEVYITDKGGNPVSGLHSPGERAPASVESSNLQSSMSVLASDTGGRAILNANDLRPDLARSTT